MSYIDYQIQSNGEWVSIPLFPTFAQSLNRPTQLFTFESKVEGSNIKSFNVPADGAEKMFGYPHCPTSRNDKYRPARIRNGGKLIACGDWIVQDGDDCDYNIQFVDNQGAFTRKNSGVSIKDLMDIEYEVPCGDEHVVTLECEGTFTEEYNIGDSISIILNGQTFTWVNNIEMMPKVDMVQNLVNVINSDPNYNVTTSFTDPLVIVITQVNLLPLTVTFVPGDPFDWVEIPTVFSPNELAECWRRYLDSRCDEDPTTLNHHFPPICNPGAYDGQNESWNDFVNAYDYLNGTYQINQQTTSDTGYNSGVAFALSPQVSVKSIIEAIEERCGYEFKGFVKDDPCFCKLTIDSGVLLDNFVQFNVNGEPRDFNQWPMSYNLADFVPDWSVLDFIGKIKEQFNLVTKTDNVERCITFTTTESILKSKPAADITNAICGNNPRVTTSDYDGFKLRYDHPDDAYYELEVKNTTRDCITTGNAPRKTVVLPFTPYQNENNYMKGSFTATTSAYDIGENENGCRMNFYHGKVMDGNGNEFPYGSGDNYAPDGTKLCEWNLFLEGDEGMFATFFDCTADSLVNGKRMNMTFKMDLALLCKLNSCSLVSFRYKGSYLCAVLDDVPIIADCIGLRQFSTTVRLTA